MQEPRLYVVGRADLAPGYRAAQAGHAAFEFAVQFPEATKAWHPGYLILLEVPDEDTLQFFADYASNFAPIATWREPDLDFQLTAIALPPTERSFQMCSELPLMHSSLGSSTPEQPPLKRKVEGESPSPGANSDTPVEVM